MQSMSQAETGQSAKAHQAVDGEEERIPQDLAVLAATQALQDLDLQA